MVFSSLTFIGLFLPLVILLHALMPSIRAKNALLLVFSLLFYAWGEPVWILAMLLSTFVSFLAARLIDQTDNPLYQRVFLFLSVAFCLSFLVYFKYAAFFTNSFCACFSIQYRMECPRLPIGISFYTFQVITYTVDVYRGRSAVQKSFGRLLLYVSFFPQLIAGPIVQYGDIEPMLSNRTITKEDFSAGFLRFGAGFSKKVLLANMTGEALSLLPHAGSAETSVLSAWLLAVLFALQIYFDFSGYSDMAIGIGRMFGFRFLENFDYPYISTSIAEFWRRWHISLGAWFRDYLLYPLQRCSVMRRMSKTRFRNLPKKFGPNLAACISTMIVWACTGLWHGASWNFVCWGLYYGVLLLLERFVFQKLLGKTPVAIRRIATLLLILIGYVIFYYENLGDGVQHILTLFAFGGALSDAVSVYVLKENAVLLIVSLLACLPWRTLLEGAAARLGATDGFARVSAVAAPILIFSAVLISVLFLVGQSFNPFLYFRF